MGVATEIAHQHGPDLVADVPFEDFTGRQVFVQGAFIHAIDALNRHKVPHLVIGGAAILLHGFDREVRDYDIWLSNSPRDTPKIRNAFTELGAEFLGFEIDDLIRQNMVSQIVEAIYTFSPFQVDFRLRADGRPFHLAYPDGVLVSRKIKLISLEDMVEMKRETSRSIDISDLKLMGSD